MLSASDNKSFISHFQANESQKVPHAFASTCSGMILDNLFRARVLSAQHFQRLPAMANSHFPLEKVRLATVFVANEAECFKHYKAPLQKFPDNMGGV